MVASIEGGLPLAIVFCIIILIANVLINVAYIVTFKVQIDDYRFNEYIKYHKHAWKFITIICIGISMHLFRLLYGKLFALPIFHAATTCPRTFYKPMMLYSLIQLFCVTLPIFLANIIFAIQTKVEHVFDN